LLSRLIPGDNDGKVSVSRAQVAGGQNEGFYRHYAHPFIMRRKRVIGQTLHFIQQGAFAKRVLS
jgi:hypothetical protein